MAKSSKNIVKARAAVTKPAYPLPEAVGLLKQVKYAKFDETVDLTMRLGVDTRHADQMVRGTVVLPHGLGKTKTVAVIASGDRQKEATEAGADFVGGEEMVEKIQKENWTAFDALIATPDMMKVVGRLGKVLGPKGLMPNPKTGTVTLDVAAAVKEIKAGKVEFRADKTSLVHVPVGKLSFDPQKLIDNATTVISSIVRAKPSAAKGKYIKSVTLRSTMGPGVPLDSAVADAAGKHHCAAHHLVSMARIDPQTHGQVDGLVKLGVLDLLEQAHGFGSGYAGLVTAARAFTIFLLDFAILPSSPTAYASPALQGSAGRAGKVIFAAQAQAPKSRGAIDWLGHNPGHIYEEYRNGGRNAMPHPTTPQPRGSPLRTPNRRGRTANRPARRFSPSLSINNPEGRSCPQGRCQVQGWQPNRLTSD